MARRASAVAAPAWPAPITTTFAAAASDLGAGHIDLDLLEIRAEHHLAPESAPGLVPGSGRALQHLLFVLADLRQPVAVAVADVDVTGRAHGLAAALADDAGDVVLQSHLHHGGALGRFDDVGLAVG